MLKIKSTSDIIIPKTLCTLTGVTGTSERKGGRRGREAVALFTPSTPPPFTPAKETSHDWTIILAPLRNKAGFSRI